MSGAQAGGTPITAVYINSDYRPTAVDSQSKFRIDLPEQISTGPNTMACVHSIMMGHSAYVVRTGETDFLFYRERTSAQGAFADLSIELDAGNYTGSTLASALG